MTALADAYKALKVLIIDSQDAFRTAIGVMLKELDVSAIYQADSGAAGYDELMRHEPDVVLCDMHVTPIDGREFLSVARESTVAVVRDVAVILLSGDNLLDTMRGAMRRHADGYLVKPFELDDLRKQLDITITLLAARKDRKPA